MIKTILTVLFLVTSASCFPEEIVECHTVKEVLACSEGECRVMLETGKRATIRDIVAPGDRVRIKMEFMLGRIWETQCSQSSRGTKVNEIP